MERQKQSTRETHSLFSQISAARHCFLSSVQPANFPAKVNRCSEWRKRLRNKSHIDIINLHEELAKGYDSPWTTWTCLNSLRPGYTCSKAQRKKWKFYIGDTTCASGKAEETTAHMLQCSILAHPFGTSSQILARQVTDLWRAPVEVGHLLVEWRGPPVNQRSRIPVRWGRYHRPECVETVVGPLHHFSEEELGRQQQ